MKTTGIDMKKIQKMKDLATNETNFKLILAMLEPFLQVRFMITHQGREVSNLREKAPVDFTPTQMIVVSLDQIFVSSKKFDAEATEAAAATVEAKTSEATATESAAEAKAELEGELEEGSEGDAEVSVPVKVPVKVKSASIPVKESAVKETAVKASAVKASTEASTLEDLGEEAEVKPKSRVAKESKVSKPTASATASVATSKTQKIEQMTRVIEEVKPNDETKFSVMKAKAREQGIPLDNEKDKDLFKELIGDYLSRAESKDEPPPPPVKSKIAAPSGANVKPKSRSKVAESKTQTVEKAETETKEPAEAKKRTTPKPRKLGSVTAP
jgi:hypothetical protein